MLRLLLFCFCIYALPLISQPSLTTERIFGSVEFQLESLGSVRWMGSGKSYTVLKPSFSVRGAVDIVEYNSRNGRKNILVDAQKLIPPGKTDALIVDDYHVSEDGKKILIFANSVKVWRDNTRGDYWVMNLRSGRLQQLGSNAPASSLMFAKFSPDGSRVAYVRENNIYVEHLDNGKITALTSDGSEQIINGTFDWAYEEELSLQDGFRWSPDGEKIAFWQLDASDTKVFYMINNTDSLYPKLIPIQYPKVGEQNSAAKVGVVSVKGGKTTWMKVEGDPRNHYLARMEWVDSDHLILQQLNRQQNRNRVMLANAGSGKISNLFLEKDEAWVELMEEMIWVEEGQSFLWLSERDGWRHIWLVSIKDGNLQCLTPGAYDVAELAGVDVRERWVYYIASPENPTQRFMFRSPLDGSGLAEQLTSAILPGTHSYNISPDATYAFHTWSSFGDPPRIELISLPDHNQIRVIATNQRVRDILESEKKSPVEFFTVQTSDGMNLEGYVMKPANFDPGKKYPLLFYVYGEPWGQTARDVWDGSRYLWHLMLTQMGYAVATVDNRGTPSLKGRDWRKSVYRQIGMLASKDQADALKDIREWNWVDEERIGIWGWSGGGSMTLNMMFRYPEMYHVGMSVAPVANQRYYDCIYQERYMGLLKDNAEGYRLGSPITYAKDLQGDLLIVHGTGDDNVHYQNAEALINELILHNKEFDMMAYPNRSHSIREGKNTSLHLYSKLTRYLTGHLPAGGK